MSSTLIPSLSDGAAPGLVTYNFDTTEISQAAFNTAKGPTSTPYTNFVHFHRRTGGGPSTHVKVLNMNRGHVDGYHGDGMSCHNNDPNWYYIYNCRMLPDMAKDQGHPTLPYSPYLIQLDNNDVFMVIEKQGTDDTWMEFCGNNGGHVPDVGDRSTWRAPCVNDDTSPNHEFTPWEGYMRCRFNDGWAINIYTCPNPWGGAENGHQYYRHINEMFHAITLRHNGDPVAWRGSEDSMQSYQRVSTLDVPE